jgi:hypothetical protein
MSRERKQRLTENEREIPVQSFIESVLVIESQDLPIETTGEAFDLRSVSQYESGPIHVPLDY